MKPTRCQTAILAFSIFFGVQRAPCFEKQADGVVFEIRKVKNGDPLRVKVQICTENIIRVIASPESVFSRRPSLMVEKSSWAPVRWSVNERGTTIEISTSRVTVRVQPSTGAVAFYDSTGLLLLKEDTGGGKIITATEAMGEPAYKIQQLFDSPEDEGFYGLGGHQNAMMNYKGHDVDLWQHNMVAVVPFLVSSRHYGLLWDNNSRTKFGDTRDYQPLSILELYARDGTAGGLTAEYFRDSTFTQLYATRTEPRIEHEFIDIHDDFPEGFAHNVAAVRWSGEIESGQSGVHKFRLCSCGYTKMWLDDKLVVDAWRQNWLPWTNLPMLEMKAGKKYRIRIEWIHTGGYISLKCLGPDSTEKKSTISLFSEIADQIDYYFIAGKDLDEVIHGYRTVTGKAPMMPRWAMGLWQSREHYASQDQILSVAGEFRKRQIPFDNIVQDWFYWKEDRWGDHEFDSTRYPDPEGMIRTLHEKLNTHMMISVWPKFYVGTKNFNAMKERGWLYMRNVEKGQRDWVGPGYISTFYDAYNPEARALYWKQIHEKLFTKGMDAWWLDCTEPDIQSNLSRPETILRQGPTALGSAVRYLNAFSLMNAKGVYEGQRSANPGQRVFILTRSAFAGQQRYSATTWSGDVASTWYDLRAQISSGMNFCLSGIPYWTMDIGGFSVEARYEHPREADQEEWRELITRWFQFGAFCPVFRVHGQFPYREMFNVAPESHPAYQAMLGYDRLRYRLMPYIYSLAGMVTRNDYTIMRALVMDFDSDRNVLGIGDQYMFGPALLVNPVTAYGARRRPVYLPSGTGWYELRSGRHFTGGQTLQADAPFSDIPVYVREGSIIPCGPQIQYAMEKPANPIRLFVYTGSDGSFALYEDEDVNTNYEQGASSVIPLSYSEKKRELTIGSREGDFAGMLSKRTFEIVWIGPGRASGLNFASKADAVVAYDGTPRSIRIQE